MSYLNEDWDDPEWQRAHGWAAKGDKVMFVGKDGRESDHQFAKKVGLVVGEIYTVTNTTIESSNSDYTLEGFPHDHNCVMFEVVKD